MLQETRNAARRLVVELLLLGLLAVVFTRLPGEDGLVSGWDFAAPVLAFVAHALLGLLVIVEAGRLVVLAAGTASRTRVYPPAVGLAATIVAVGAGAALLVGAPVAGVRASMVLGWLVGVTMFAMEWYVAARAMRRLAGSRPEPERAR
jgi:hypothetical protein